MQAKKNLRLLFIFLFVSVFSESNAQSQKDIDSLIAAVNVAKSDTAKISLYDALGSQYVILGLAPSLQYYRKSLELENDSTRKRERAITLRRMGNSYFHNMIYEKAMEYYLQSLKFATEAGDKPLIAAANGNIGNIYSRQGDLSGNEADYNKSIEYQTKAMNIAKEIGDSNFVTNCMLNIGNPYMGLGQYEKALENYLTVLTVYERKHADNGVDLARINIGEAYLAFANKTHEKKYYDKAKEYFLERITTYGEGSTPRKAGLLKDMGEIYLRLNDFPNALNYLNNALQMAKETHETEAEKDAAKLLAELYQKKGDFQKAFEYSQLNDVLKDSLLNQQKSSDMTRMQIAYDTEEKESQIKTLETDQKISQLENAKTTADLERQRIITITSIIAVVLLGGFAFLLFNRYKLKQKANEKLSFAYDIIEKKNIQITDSITYAKRIQDSILPSEEMLQKYFPESFIFFQPRDIVSGDFYWFSERAGKLFIAVADCTGHGVPGAFMSMIGNTLLNEIVNEKGIYDPSEILSRLDEGVSTALSQSKNEKQTQEDGMDISFCVIDKTKKEIEFASANHSLYVFKSGKPEIVFGDIYSIGGVFGKKGKSFTKKKISIGQNTVVFMSTDGYHDQFGGEKKKKFMSGRFEEMLGKCANENSANQKKTIGDTFNSWKGENKQLDDVLVIGMKL
jgi:serine phosphatase RsbU (regulator of sigma subunit)